MAKRRYKSEEEETSYWLSYSDMMAGLLLVFVLIITFTMLQAKTQYEEKQAELEAKEALLGEQKEIMQQQQEQLDKVIGVKSDLIEALKTEFEGTELKVSVDEKTGAIAFDSNVLFDYNKDNIKQQGIDFLSEFLPHYFSVLLNPEFRGYVSEVIIEGHTDTNGSYLYNLDLSQKRALSVAAFCLSDSNTFISNDDVLELREIVTANGRSFSSPIFDELGNVDMGASRRVEFKFRLTNEEMIEEMMKILDGEINLEE